MLFLFLGFPSSWDKVLALLSGLLIVGVAYQLGSTSAISAADVVSKDAPFADSKIKDTPINTQASIPTDTVVHSPPEATPNQ